LRDRLVILFLLITALVNVKFVDTSVLLLAGATVF
jgi:hypothetical protein